MSVNLRESIISVATDLFMKNGYLATSTRDIASILNVSQPSIYHHFKNKEAIYAEVLERFAVEIGNSIKEILTSDHSYEKRLIETSIYLKNNHAVNFSLMMNDIESELSDAVQYKVFTIWQQNYFQPIRDFFEAIAQYIGYDLNPEIASRHYLRLLSAYLSKSTYGSDVSDDDVHVAITIFLRGVIKSSDYDSFIESNTITQ
ncbi:TetR/AcrR family transcriptional regulator [Erysipelothrix sp. HDW6C]|uniref:TetR/AcrR family transcriptional regulator n=1 Tax=Erysipelothrix sp. HDW6C TaxID=2714930 RepID=UPI00140D42E4|nr:TetR/AcrR family transcriptional regulator [Erysipelothrix sp. HDW6C]QIK68779.1 TetR/AcrR family transcriptional regulator [Erysipelothrix sp. HDW6C]